MTRSDRLTTLAAHIIRGDSGIARLEFRTESGFKPDDEISAAIEQYFGEAGSGSGEEIGTSTDVSIASVSGTYTPSNQAGVHILTLTGDLTLNPPSTLLGKACAVEVHLIQDATGGHVVTFGGSPQYSAVPVVKLTPGAITRVLLTAADGVSGYFLDPIDPIAQNPVLPRFYPGRWYASGFARAGTNSGAQGVGTLKVCPLPVTQACTFDLAAINVSTAGEAGSQYRIVVYSDDGTGYPGALLSETVIAASTSGSLEGAVDFSAGPGVIWVGGAVQTVTTTQPTMFVNDVSSPYVGGKTSSNALGGAMGYTTTGVTGAAPSVFPSGASTTGSVTRVALRVSA